MFNISKMLTYCVPTAVLSTLLGISVFAQFVYAESAFDHDLDGWTTANDTRDFAWISDAGNPPGSIFARDVTTGAWWYFVAPGKFLGNKAGVYGGSLSWEVNPNLRNANDDSVADVILRGAGLTLVMNLPMPTVNTWNRYTVSLLETAGWRKTSFTGAVPTQTEMLSVLSDLTSIWLRGEFRSGADAAYLDNVVLIGLCPNECHAQGDINEDGVVDDLDLLEVLFSFGDTGPGISADVNCDGAVDDNDLLLILFNFGLNC